MTPSIVALPGSHEPLYSGGGSRKNLYIGELAERWQREQAHFRFVSVRSEPTPEDHWTSRTAWSTRRCSPTFPTPRPSRSTSSGP